MEDALKVLKVEYIGNRKISNVEYLSNHWLDLFQNLDFSLEEFKWKTNSNGRWSQSIEGGIYRQPLIGSFSNFKLKLSGPI